MVCQVCFQPNRKTRFQTFRIEICQWCVNEICNSETSPSLILSRERLAFQQCRSEKLNREILRFESRRTPPPIQEQSALQNIEKVALRKAIESESFLAYLYRSLVDDSARIANAQTIKITMQEQLVAAHKEDIARHSLAQQQIDSSLAHLRLDMLNVPMAAAQDLQDYLQSILITSPTKSKDVRLLRAHYLGILSAVHEPVERPDDNDFDVIRRTVRQQDGCRCSSCKKDSQQAELHVHHIIPLSRYGTNSTRNLVTLCYSCHNKQHPDIKVSRNQSIRRHKPQRRQDTLSRMLTSETAKNKLPNRVRLNLPQSRAGWMDCPTCLSSIQLDSELEPICLECGWKWTDDNDYYSLQI